jgi:hypothetical protein
VPNRCLDQAERRIRERHGSSLDDVLDVEPRPEHLRLLRILGQADGRLGVEPFVAWLLEITVSGGTLDPVNLCADVPWAFLVGHIAATHPRLAATTARRLVAHVSLLTSQRPPVAVPVFVTALHLVSIAERLAGRPEVGEAWTLLGHVVAMRRSRRRGLGLACYVRAARLLSLSPMTSRTARLSS